MNDDRSKRTGEDDRANDDRSKRTTTKRGTN
ncbi:hypothetical protein ZOD2009_07239 [Haladaptatus paucihalophilus DX253]|uniref:Uncharacterized protein n=1 Tax=Haladaptatus paucihalophilus DX253 TaxID=797209 RepID=E7QRM5_HALPU|nr:hypothetical protein ZOD2009_07239 [Haladaptatus paucihalophilus DX253]